MRPRLAARLPLLLVLFTAACAGGGLDLRYLHLERRVEGLPGPRGALSTLVLDSPDPAPLDSPLSDSLRVFLEETVWAPLAAGAAPAAPESLAAAFEAAYREFRSSFPETSQVWHLKRRVERLAAPEGLLSLAAFGDEYLGGAHGMQRLRLVTLDVRTGRRLGLDALLRPGARPHVRALAAAAIRRQRGLAQGAPLEDAGFTLGPEGFTLTDNCALTLEGLRLRWDAYALGPYVLGPTDLLLDAAQVDSLLAPRP